MAPWDSALSFVCVWVFLRIYLPYTDYQFGQPQMRRDFSALLPKSPLMPLWPVISAPRYFATGLAFIRLCATGHRKVGYHPAVWLPCLAPAFAIFALGSLRSLWPRYFCGLRCIPLSRFSIFMISTAPSKSQISTTRIEENFPFLLRRREITVPAALCPPVLQLASPAPEYGSEGQGDTAAAKPGRSPSSEAPGH